MATLRFRRREAKRARRVNPLPFAPSWTPGPSIYGVGVRHNVAVPMSDNIVLSADIHYPTVPETGQPAAGPFPVLLSGNALRQKGAATSRPDQRWRDAVSD